MKKQVKVLIMAIILVFTSVFALTVEAANAAVTLKVSKNELNPGDEFIITFEAECSVNLEGIDSNLIYDKENLELIEVNAANSNWQVMDSDMSDVPTSNYDMNIVAFLKKDAAITKGDIYSITFKVKEEASVGTKVKISLNEIALYDSNSQMYEVGTKEIEVSILEKQTETPGGDEGGNNEQIPGENEGGNNEQIPGENEGGNNEQIPGENEGGNNEQIPGENEGGNNEQTPGENEEEDNEQNKKLTAIKITKEPTKKMYEVGEKFDKTGMKVIAEYSDGTSKEITNYAIENGEKLDVNQTNVRIRYTENSITKTVEQKITVVAKTINDNKQDGDKKEESNKETDNKKEDNTKTEEKMPDTGSSSIAAIIAIVAVFGIVGLVKHNKYKQF